jgi:hypothetical protein
MSDEFETIDLHTRWILFRFNFWRWLRKYIPERKRFYFEVTQKIRIRMPLVLRNGRHIINMDDAQRCEKKAILKYYEIYFSEELDEQLMKALGDGMQLLFVKELEQ